MDPTAADMLGGAHHRGVAGVEVHLERIRDVARHHGTLEEVDVFHHIDDATDVVEVADGGFAVAAVGIDHVDGRTGGAEVGALAPRLHVVARILPEEREMTRGLGDGVLDEGSREQQTTRIVERATGGGHDLDAGFCGITEPDFPQQPERSLVDLLDARLRQRLEPPARHAGTDRAQVIGQRTRSLGPAGITTGRTTGDLRICVHELGLLVGIDGSMASPFRAMTAQ